MNAYLCLNILLLQSLRQFSKICESVIQNEMWSVLPSPWTGLYMTNKLRSSQTFLRLGYDEKLAQKAIQTRGKDADENDLLRVLISIVDSQKAMEYVKRNKAGTLVSKVPLKV